MCSYMYVGPKFEINISCVLVALEFPMLHTKFQDIRLFGSGEDLYRFLPYMGMAAIICDCVHRSFTLFRDRWTPLPIKLIVEELMSFRP